MNKKGFDHRAGRRPLCYPAGSNQCTVKEEGHHGTSLSSVEHYVKKSLNVGQSFLMVMLNISLPVVHWEDVWNKAAVEF